MFKVHCQLICQLMMFSILVGWVPTGIAEAANKNQPTPSEGAAEAAVLVGRVLDAASQPLGDALVELFGVTDAEGEVFDDLDEEGRSAAPVRSDADGRFEITGVAPGHYLLKLEAPGHALHVLASVTVPVDAGFRDLGDQKLEKEAVFDLLVVDPEGHPVPDAGVHVHYVHVANTRQNGYSAVQAKNRHQGKTDATGHFRLAGLQPNQVVRVSILHPQYVSAQRQVMLSDETLKVTLDQGVILRGKVVDAQGRALPEARLQVTMEPAVEGQRFLGGTSSRSGGSSDTDGGFEIFGVTPGKVTLLARLKGYAPGLVTLMVASEDEVDGLTVELAAGLELQGRVVDEAGNALPGVNVSVRFEGATEKVSPRSITSQDDGRFRLSSLPAGPMTIQARDRQGRRTSHSIVLKPDLAPLTLILESGQILRGRVVDANGQGVQGAEIRLRGPATMKTQGSGDDGRFVVALEGEGNYTLAVTREDMGWAEVPVHVPDGESVNDVELKLPTGGRIVGQISGLQADDLDRLDLRATLWSPELKLGGTTRRGRVELDGTLQIDGMFPGKWDVRAEVRGSARRARQMVQIDGAGETVVALDLGDAGLTLTGQVLHNGEPAPHVMIDPGSIQADDAGRFHIEGIEPGPYRIHLFGPWGSHVHEGEIYADGEVEISIDSFQLAGQVVDGDGRPVEGVEVHCMEPGAPRSMLTASETEAGRFEIPGLNPGTFQLMAQKSGYGTASVVVELTGSRDDLVITLHPTEALALEVQGPAGGPVDGLTVVVLDASGQPSGMNELKPQDDGRFLVDFVAAGTWDLLLMAEGSAPSRLSVEVPGGPYAAQLQRRTQLSVKVPDLAEGETAASLSIVDGEGRSFSPRMVGMPQRQWPMHRGHFSFPLLPPGDWQLTVIAEDGRRWQGSAVTSAAETTEVVLP